MLNFVYYIQRRGRLLKIAKRGLFFEATKQRIRSERQKEDNAERPELGLDLHRAAFHSFVHYLGASAPLFLAVATLLCLGWLNLRPFRAPQEFYGSTAVNQDISKASSWETHAKLSRGRGMPLPRPSSSCDSKRPRTRTNSNRGMHNVLSQRRL